MRKKNNGVFSQRQKYSSKKHPVLEHIFRKKNPQAKLVWEYFGGMYLNLLGVHQTLKKGGKIYLLVSDLHAFKMVHIETAKILAEIGLKIGFSSSGIQLWQDKISTSHKYHIPENILILTK